LGYITIYALFFNIILCIFLASHNLHYLGGVWYIYVPRYRWQLAHLIWCFGHGMVRSIGHARLFLKLNTMHQQYAWCQLQLFNGSPWFYLQN
jgi:hypothetical protein